jgi:hypothetical protein
VHTAGLATANCRAVRLPSGLARWRNNAAAAAAAEQAWRLGALAAVEAMLRRLLQP